MTTFSYTHNLDQGFSSSVLDEAYYNTDTKELLVDLNDSLYVYDNVPLGAWSGLVDADSKGTYYAKYIKPVYGKATAVGTYGDVSYKKVASFTPASTVRPSWERERDSSGRFVSSKPAPLASVGTKIDQSSVQASSLVADNIGDAKISYLTEVPVETAKKFSLGVVSSKVNSFVPPKQRHSVKFTTTGADEKVYSLDAASVQDAIDGLTEVADALGVNFTVKEVTVYFD